MSDLRKKEEAWKSTCEAITDLNILLVSMDKIILNEETRGLHKDVLSFLKKEAKSIRTRKENLMQSHTENFQMDCRIKSKIDDLIQVLII